MESLVWVVVDRRPTHISAFADLPPKRRPHAMCPVCGRRLTLKLGAVRRHHAAHAAGAVCAATNPETALHLDCKLAIAEALRCSSGANRRLSIVRACADACDETSTVEWFRDWDDVLVEHRVGDAEHRRPDIVLTRNGAAVAAIEIVASNGVSDEKAAALASLGLTWIEVAADERLVAPGAWSTAQPLPVRRTGLDGVWRCAVHEAQMRILMDAEAARRVDAREAARHTVALRAARVVDVYRAGGARDRFIYRITVHATDGRVHSARIQRGGLEIATIPLSANDDERATVWPRLRAAFAADLEHAARDDGAFTDSPMRWATGGAAQNIVDEALHDRVGTDPTPLATTFPRRWFYARDRGQWFLAPELRDARWDRDPLDPFAAHPGWAATRNAVRERPAPSWNTTVFAARPIAAMFFVRPITTDATGAVACVEVSGRTVIVIERPASDAAIAHVAESLGDRAGEAIWLSHPSDWRPSLSAMAWAPAGRDARGRGAIVIDDVGTFSAAQFIRALEKGDARLSSAKIRMRMAGRVARLLDAR